MSVLLREDPDQPSPAGVEERWLAFEAFVREQFPALCVYANRYLRSREAAEEVVQDVLLRVWTRRDRMRHIELVPYVYRSVAHAAISRLRSERATRARDLRLQQQASSRGPVESPATAEELEAHVRRAIEALPERSRMVFLLSRDVGLTYAAIAERLGIAPKTVENQIIRALRLLRAALKPYLVMLFAFGAAEQIVGKLS